MSHFELSRPRGGDVPVFVEVPHAGLTVPEDVKDTLSVSNENVMRDADIYVDRLYELAPEAGATYLVARTSRYVVDLNRASDDVDAETVQGHPKPQTHQPRGVVWRMTTDGQRCLSRPLTMAEFEGRISRYHRPYHEAIEGELERLQARFGHAILVAAHSMPSVGRSAHADRGIRRADVVPGTRGRTTAAAAVIDLVHGHFRAAGLSVRHDEPYRGGYTTGFYGRPQTGWHAVQIELNRALYVNEATLELREADATRLTGLLRELVTKLGTLDMRAT